MTELTCLVIGGSGAIGSAIVDEFVRHGFEVWTSSRFNHNLASKQIQLIGQQKEDLDSLSKAPVFNAVVWAQGENVNDNISEFSENIFNNIFQANVGFVVSTLSTVISTKRITDGTRLCVISSIWQEAIKPNKFSYAVAKSALSGLVQSAAIDLAPKNILINAILPGVLDTPMTKSMLSLEQIESVASRTGFGRLATPEGVASLCHYLCSPLNTIITGQSIVADLGFSNVRPI